MLFNILLGAIVLQAAETFGQSLAPSLTCAPSSRQFDFETPFSFFFFREQCPSVNLYSHKYHNNLADLLYPPKDPHGGLFIFEPSLDQSLSDLAVLDELYPKTERPSLVDEPERSISMARVYADANAQMPRAYWDYDSVNISWGVLENYEVVRKIGIHPNLMPYISVSGG